MCESDIVWQCLAVNECPTLSDSIGYWRTLSGCVRHCLTVSVTVWQCLRVSSEIQLWSFLMFDFISKVQHDEKMSSYKDFCKNMENQHLELCLMTDLRVYFVIHIVLSFSLVLLELEKPADFSASLSLSLSLSFSLSLSRSLDLSVSFYHTRTFLSSWRARQTCV